MGQHCVGENQLPSGEREASASLLVTRDPPPSFSAAESATFRLQQRPSDTDPLRWFSALPPGALRDAQQQFRRAAEIACDIASLKSQLKAMVARLEEARGRRDADTELRTAQLTEAVEALTVT